MSLTVIEFDDQQQTLLVAEPAAGNLGVITFDNDLTTYDLAPATGAVGTIESGPQGTTGATGPQGPKGEDNFLVEVDGVYPPRPLDENGDPIFGMVFIGEDLPGTVAGPELEEGEFWFNSVEDPEAAPTYAYKIDFDALTAQVNALVLADMDDVADSPATEGQVLKRVSGQWIGSAQSNPRDPRWAVPSGVTSIDEFNDNSLDTANWVRVDTDISKATWLERGDTLSAQHTAVSDAAAELHALLRGVGTSGGAIAPGDAFTTCLTCFGPPAANYVMGGLILADGLVPTSGRQVITLNYIGTTGQTNDARDFTGFNAQVGTPAANIITPSGARCYVRLVCLTTTTFRCDISPDGASWIKGAVLTVAAGFTPGYVGLHTSNWGATQKGVVQYEFFRRMSGVT